MKRLFVLCCALLPALFVQAQFLGVPQFGRNIKVSGEPKTGFDGLYVGDEGYVTFQVVNQGDSIYTGPIYLRLFDREQSLQVLAAKKIKLKPGRTYSITTVFSTERLRPYSRYFMAFEYDQDGHTIPMGFVEPAPLKNFMLLPEIINNPPKKAPVKAKVKEVKK